MSKSRPLFFVVTGTHGVGKTTVLEAAESLFSEKGIPARRFHHVTDVLPWKKEAPGKKSPASGSSSSSGRWRRLVPSVLKQLAASARDEWTYARGINRILAEAETQKQIALSDRYVYDRLVDLRLHQRPVIQRMAVRILCSLMRKPTLTILLIDDPKAIRARKKELSETQIAWYQGQLEELCAHVGGPLELVPVKGRDPQGLARELVSRILKTARDCGCQVERS